MLISLREGTSESRKGVFGMYDVTIIGAGVVGTAVARELSKYKLKVCLLERSDDVASGATKANSGIVHGAYATKYGTLKAKLAREGNQLYDELNEDLHFGFSRIGALVLAFNEEEYSTLGDLYANGIKNGCEDMEILDQSALRKLEPMVSDEAYGALHAKDVGITSPYEMAIALAENAVHNGVTMKLGYEVDRIETERAGYKLYSNDEYVETKYIVNAAGIYTDRIAQMILGRKPSFEILPRKGQYVLLDRKQGALVNHVLFQVPSKLGKGILVSKTFHGNLMIGPNAEDMNEREDYGTDVESLKDVIDKAKKSVPEIQMKRAITTYSGVRAISSGGDFIVEALEDHPGVINLAGIDSPGLTAAPAIALRTLKYLEAAGLVLSKNEQFNPKRAAIIRLKAEDEVLELEASDPNTHMICRCERVTEAEIVDAIHRGIPIVSTDMIKRRTRAGMGPCQGQFCRPRVTQIIERETQLKEAPVRGAHEGEKPNRVPLSVIRTL